MMSVKIFGCILIIAACTIAGFQISSGYKERVFELSELLRDVYQLENEMVYTHTPLPEAFVSVSLKSKEPISTIFSNTGNMLCTNKVDSVFDAVKKSINDLKDVIYLKNEDVSIILDLSKSLGQSDLEGQKNIFLLAIESLKKQSEEAERLMRKNIKMFRYMGFSLGTILVIMIV